MILDLAILSRLQFAFTIGFHILWPTLTIGLGLFLLILESLWLKTGKLYYQDLYRFWVKIFALAFGMGIVTGIPLSYQFGTNFSGLSEAAGGVLGPLLSVEVMTAFFLEAAFIGVMIFGWNKVPPLLHFLATLFVVLGTHNSAFWIIVANSWMHTPQGIDVVNGTFFVTDWWKVIFSPSMPYRFFHSVLASYISALLVILGVSAGYLRKNPDNILARKPFSLAIIFLCILMPIQIILGDLHGLMVKQYQPVKVAAMEALWETRHGAPLVLFAVPNSHTERNDYALEIPYLSSIVLTHSVHGEVKGLKDWPASERPPVAPVFYSFRVMVGLGGIFMLLAFSGLYLTYRKRFNCKAYLWSCMLIAPLGFVATICGWIVAEVGRQPYVVYGYLKTKDALSPVIPQIVLGSLIGFVIVYSLMLTAFLFYACKVIKKGPVSSLEDAHNLKNEEWLRVTTHTNHLTPNPTGKKEQ